MGTWLDKWMSFEYHDSLSLSELMLDCRSRPYTLSLDFCLGRLESLVELPFLRMNMLRILLTLLALSWCLFAGVLQGHAWLTSMSGRFL